MSNIQNKIKFNDLDIFNKKINNNILKILKKDFDKNEFIFGQSVETNILPIRSDSFAANKG